MFGLGKDFSNKTLMAQATNERKSYYINIKIGASNNTKKMERQYL